MPNCVQLYRKSDMAAGPVSFNVIDEEMRAYFEQPADPDHYLTGWYSSIGMWLAMGKSFHYIIGRYAYDSPNPALHAIAVWLNEHFTANSWSEMGRGHSD